jgi:hypothetical protein
VLTSGIQKLSSQLKDLAQKYDAQIMQVERMGKDTIASASLRGVTTPTPPASNVSQPIWEGPRHYEVLENTATTKLPYWRPFTGGHVGHPDQPLVWNPSFPELCKYKVTDVSEANKLPGYGSKKVALAFRGDSFRGLSYGKTICMTGANSKQRICGKLPFYCTKKAREIQKATAKSHLKNIVGALEKQGLSVDIYIATYGCSGLEDFGISEAQAQEYYDDLISWYAPYVVSHRLIKRVPGMTQDTGTQRTAQLLLDNAPLDYQSVLMWRFDMPTIMPMEDTGLMKSDQNEQAWVDWMHYGERSAWVFFWYDGEWSHHNIPFCNTDCADDWGYSIPGWFLNCALGTFLHNCMDNDLHCQWGMNANFPGDKRMVWHEGSHNMRFNVYRNDYDKQGRPICETLAKEFGGPSCGEKVEDSWREACRQIKAISNVTRSWDQLAPFPVLPKGVACLPGRHVYADCLASLGAP